MKVPLCVRFMCGAMCARVHSDEGGAAVIAAVVPADGGAPMQRTLLSDYDGARCLDGTPGAHCPLPTA